MLEARTGEYRDLAKNLLGVDRKIVLGMRRTLRAEAKPLGDRINAAIGEAMPSRGGLSGRVLSTGRVSLLVDLQRGVKISLANKLGMFMEQFEKGDIRHPGWGRKGKWYAQPVPGGKGAEEFTKGSEALRNRVIEVVAETIKREL